MLTYNHLQERIVIFSLSVIELIFHVSIPPSPPSFKTELKVTSEVVDTDRIDDGTHVSA